MNTPETITATSSFAALLAGGGIAALIKRAMRNGYKVAASFSVTFTPPQVRKPAEAAPEPDTAVLPAVPAAPALREAS